MAREDPILRDLAAKVRHLREAKQWSRADLSRRSGLSTRFLARVESGAGNISVVRLGDLAAALGTDPSSLLRDDRRRAPVVVLVGMRGAGKSTVGPEIARLLGVPFLEMEEKITEASGLPLDQLFELHGEAYYRRVEREILSRILAEGRAVTVAAAGGVVNDPATWRMLLEDATVVWLKAKPEDHWKRVVDQGDRRPMADNPDAMAELRAMLSARESLYRQAHVQVDTSSRSPVEVAEDVYGELRRDA